MTTSVVVVKFREHRQFSFSSRRRRRDGRLRRSASLSEARSSLSHG